MVSRHITPDTVPLFQLIFIMTEAVGPIVFNKQHALNRLGGMEDVLRDVMELMTTESRKVHAEIGDSYRHGDSIRLKRSAHTLKGSMGIIGACDLVQRLKRVEDAAATGDFRIAVVEFDEIDRQFAELQRLLALELEA